jgi:hypothetical protein
LVLFVLPAIGFSKVIPSIVGSIAVYVVYLIRRPLSGHVKPSEAMGGVPPVFKHHADVASNHLTTGSISWFSCSALYLVGKCSGALVVLKKFAQTLCGNIGGSHEAVLSLIGQRPACVTSAVRASLF